MTTTVPNTGNFTIRSAQIEDLLDIIRIENESFPQPWPYQGFEQFLDRPGFLVAEHIQTVVGYIVADMTTPRGAGKPIGHIKDFAVHPDYRNRGIGTALLNRAFRILSHHGIRHVKLEVREHNEPALAVYNQFGFEPYDRIPRYYDDGADALILLTEIPDD